MNHLHPPIGLKGLLARSLAAALILGWAGVPAGAVDIADTPINSTTLSKAKPNIMLLMDTSISMSFTHAPDQLEFGTSTAPLPPAAQPVGYRANQCNSLYYNPATTYRLPVDAAGVTLLAPAFEAAPYDYYISGSATPINLNTGFQAFDHNSRSLRSTNPSDWPSIDDKAQRAYYYVYTGSVDLNLAEAYKRSPCSDAYDPTLLNTHGTLATTGGSWQRVLVGDPATVAGTSGVDERNNFAVWYTYYRTRMALAKSGIGLAFAGLTPPSDNFRVGFITANPLAHAAGAKPVSGASVDASYYLPLGSFGDTPATLTAAANNHKTDWYTKLYSQQPEGTSPMREGLARVGRHYAHKDDLINKGMAVVDASGRVDTPKPEDIPGNFSCQQNFTIMTTDGYWNRAAETLGGIDIDGKPVGQRDGTLNSVDGYNYGINVTPRPIWDGGTTGKTETTSKSITYAPQSCTTNWIRKTVTQDMQSTSVLQKRTSQTRTYTTTRMQTTRRMKKTTTQSLQQTLQSFQSTSQSKSRQVATTQSTSQLQMQVIQYWQAMPTIYTTQLTKATSQTTKSTTQLKMSTAQMLKSTSQLTISQYQTTAATLRKDQSSTQMKQTTSQVLQATSQALQTTSQAQQSTQRSTQSTSQWWGYATEGWIPSSCSVTSATCYQVVTGPTNVLPGSCTPQTASSTNSYLSISCVNTNTGPTSVPTCTPVTADGVTTWTTTTCSYPSGNNFTDKPVQTCTAATASSPNWITTTCSYPAATNSAATPVQSCSGVTATSGNGWKATTCTNPAATNFSNRAVASCAPVTPVAPDWITTTCNNNPTGPTPTDPALCVNSGSASTSPYLVKVCTFVPTAAVVVDSCTDKAAASNNNWTATTCATINASGPTPTATCNPANASGGNSHVTTTCDPGITAPTPVASCTASGSASASPFLVTTCNNNLTGPTPVASCTAGGSTSVSPYMVTTCDTNATGPTVVASCAPSGSASQSPYLVTTCNTTPLLPPTATGTCTAGTGPAPDYIVTVCTSPATTPVAVASCTPIPINAAGQTTLCGNTGAVVGAPCTSAGNLVCTSTVITPWTGVAACSPIAASATNGWQETQCRTNTTGPTPVAACAASGTTTAAPYLVTTCSTTYTPANGSYVWAACTANITANANNNWTGTECVVTPTGPTAVQAGTCAAQTADATNNYLAITCAPPDTTLTPIKASNCAAQVASATNGWKDINCTWSTPVDTYVTSTSATSFNCSALSGNSSPYVKTTCTPETATIAVAPTACIPASSANSGNNYTTTACADSPTTPVYTPVDPALCSGLAVAASATNGWTQTICDAPLTGPTASSAANCPGDSVASATNGWTATTCHALTTGPTAVAHCEPSGSATASPYLVTTCAAGPTSGATDVPVGQCAATSQSAGPDYIGTTCVPIQGQKVMYHTTTTVASSTYSGGTVVSAVTGAAVDGPTREVDGTCYTPAQQSAAFWTSVPSAFVVTVVPPTIPVTIPTTPALATLSSVPELTLPTGCLAWPCSVTTGSVAGGSTNSLADVAQYYYITDLRPDLMDNVPAGTGTGPEDDRVKWQHMTTYTVGLGVSGDLGYTQDYFQSTSGDFAKLRTGALSWPVWPDASFTDTTPDTLFSNKYSIDDFWHASVNGRGRFFSARDPATMLSGLKGALDSIESSIGAGGKGATAGTLIMGNNTLFTTGYTSGKWTGDVQMNTIRVVGTGAVPVLLDKGYTWSAQEQLDLMVKPLCDKRDIRLIRMGATKNLTKFAWDTKACDSSGNPSGSLAPGLNAAEQAYFGASPGDAGSVAVDNLSQFSNVSLSTAGQRSAAKGANLVNYLRGEKAFENFLPGDANRLYRVRDHALGDIIDSSLVYVAKPSLAYSDSGYDKFKSDWALRRPMAYVGANDGMLHAFYTTATNATTPDAGAEAWAVIPTPVLPNMVKLADVAYGSHHQFYVDGTPTVGDVYTGGAWKTILVGGLNKGGRGFYAMDITDPANPAALWEYTVSNDNTVGLSFGRPIITKLADGTWVALLTSGYNNTSPGDGKGYLYVVDAGTGALIRRISTGVVGSGLRDLTTYVSNPLQDNSALRVYAGDLLGNVWRFDINSGDATLITTLYDTATPPAPQPITTRINLAEVNGSTFLMVGTGQLLGVADVSSTQVQSVYSIKDPLTPPATPGAALIDPASLRGLLKPMAMSTLSGSGASGNLVRTAACSGDAAACASTMGWAMNLTEPRERINIDMGLAGESLVFQSNVPIDDACSTGYNLLNFINFQTGEPYDGANQPVSQSGSAALATGSTLLPLPVGAANACEIVQIVTHADGTTSFSCVPTGTPPPLGKRISWREIAK